MADLAPLEDPRCEPAYKPVDGRAPEVVKKWGPRSQLRWFMRFRSELRPAPVAYWARFYCDSTEHPGLCCTSCIGDTNEGYTDVTENHCCCLGARKAY